jgi:hypothetical protein
MDDAPQPAIDEADATNSSKVYLNPRFSAGSHIIRPAQILSPV